MYIQYANTEAHFPTLYQISMTDNNNLVEHDGKSVLKKGLLWQHKDKLFSRWKERYFVLTKDYLSCFKKATKIAHSTMGGFIFKLNLVDMEGLRWLNPTQKTKESDVIVLELPKRQGPNILLKGEGLMDWFILLQKTIGFSKERREILRSSSSSLPRGTILTSQLSDGKVAISPHLYALQHTMSDSTIGTKTSQSSDSTNDRSNLRNVSDHQRTPHLNKRNRISILTELDIDKESKIISDVETDQGIDLGTPSPQTTPVQITHKKLKDTKSVPNNRGLVKSYSHVSQLPVHYNYLCTSSPSINRQRHSKSDACFHNSIGSSSSQHWGRESPVLSQGSAYAKHVLSSPITGSRRNKKYSSFIESPSKNKKNKGGAVKSATTEFAFMQPVSSKRRARTLPDNRHLNRSMTAESGSKPSQRFSIYYDHMTPPSHNNDNRRLGHQKQMSYGLLRFIDSDGSPSPEL